MDKLNFFVAGFLIIVLFIPSVSYASEDQDRLGSAFHLEDGQKGPEYLEDGTPNCLYCHTQDRKPAIDYTSDPECLQCHSADYTERFVEIDRRYKVPIQDATKKYRESTSQELVAINPQEGPVNTTASSTKKYKIPKDMVLVPSGEFTMGTDDWWPKSSPEHKRYLPDYFIDKYETTNAEYMEFVKTTKRRMPEHWLENRGKIPSGKENHPVTYVSWFDAAEYCKWQGKRLPSEAEWEKAARGTDARAFPWGNDFEANRANTPQYWKNQGKAEEADTLPVGRFENGKSPYGVYDLAGNVFEWVEDWYTAYPGNKHPDPNAGKRYRIVRGGSWYDCTYYKCGISSPTYNRIFFNPFTNNNNFGFRCAKNP